MLNESMELIPPNDINRILQKDALYNAIGLAAFELFDEVDFDQWFSRVCACSCLCLLSLFLACITSRFVTDTLARTEGEREQLSHPSPSSRLVARPMDWRQTIG